MRHEVGFCRVFSYEPLVVSTAGFLQLGSIDWGPADDGWTPRVEVTNSLVAGQELRELQRFAQDCTVVVRGTQGYLRKQIEKSVLLLYVDD